MEHGQPLGEYGLLYVDHQHLVQLCVDQAQCVQHVHQEYALHQFGWAVPDWLPFTTITFPPFPYQSEYKEIGKSGHHKDGQATEFVVNARLLSDVGVRVR